MGFPEAGVSSGCSILAPPGWSMFVSSSRNEHLYSVYVATFLDLGSTMSRLYVFLESCPGLDTEVQEGCTLQWKFQ